MRENAAAKARRYLCEARLTISYVDDTDIVATCRGDGAVWHPQVHGASWSCDCPARGRCAHLIALGLVVVVHQGGAPR